MWFDRSLNLKQRNWYDCLSDSSQLIQECYEVLGESPRSTIPSLSKTEWSSTLGDQLPDFFLSQAENLIFKSWLEINELLVKNPEKLMLLKELFKRSGSSHATERWPHSEWDHHLSLIEIFSALKGTLFYIHPKQPLLLPRLLREDCIEIEWIHPSILSKSAIAEAFSSWVLGFFERFISDLFVVEYRYQHPIIYLRITKIPSSPDKT